MKTLEQVVAALPPEVQARYDFSNAVYAGANVRITGIRCPHHGEFSQYAGYLRRSKAGCPACGNQIRGEAKAIPKHEFIARCKEIHAGLDYDYSNTTYLTMADSITVVCPRHGPFSVKALKHYYNKNGCVKCRSFRRALIASSS